MSNIDIEQGSDAWKRIRLGKVTASRVADVVARIKTGYGASRANYMADLVVERLTGIPADGFVSQAMQWGTDMEAEAKTAYAFLHNAAVTEAGFVAHPVIPMSGASPDGFVGPDGLIETKCPNSGTHIETLLDGKIPARYQTQMQWQMACTGRAWCDFASFDPRLPENMRLFVRRLPRDEARIAELEAEVKAFLAELDARVANLVRIYGSPEVVTVPMVEGK